MEMCYNGSLVMPCNYAVINDNEMEYVEGGGIPNWTVNVAISAVFMAIGIGTGLKALKALKSASGKYFAKKSVNELAKKLGISIGAIIVGNIVAFLVSVLDPVGWLINTLDRLDGSCDGWIAGRGWSNWTALSFSNF